MSTHSLKEEYELCQVGNHSHEHFKVDDTYVDNSSQVVSAWNPVRKYSAGRSHTGAHLRHTGRGDRLPTVGEGIDSPQ